MGCSSVQNKSGDISTHSVWNYDNQMQDADSKKCIIAIWKATDSVFIALLLTILLITIANNYECRHIIIRQGKATLFLYHTVNKKVIQGVLDD